ncbi:hypothetical protein CDIK_1235 [Cucumispora dikerogammari]|nr:hypothetical protein CDIK_1235 [Cucumispora dikerogammari]
MKLEAVWNSLIKLCQQQRKREDANIKTLFKQLKFLRVEIKKLFKLITTRQKTKNRLDKITNALYKELKNLYKELNAMYKEKKAVYEANARFYQEYISVCREAIELDREACIMEEKLNGIFKTCLLFFEKKRF